MEFVWSHDGGYATRDANGKVAIFQDFKEATSFKPAFNAEELYGGRLLGIKGTAGGGDGFVCFHDWTTGRLIRRIDVTPLTVHWSESGNYCCITTEDAAYTGLFNRPRGGQRQAGSQILEGSFLVVSTPIFAIRYSFESS